MATTYQSSPPPPLPPVPPVPRPPPPYPPPAPPHTCPAGATCIGASNGLLLVKGDLQTWTGARDRCIAIGGVLAGIHSQAIDDTLEVGRCRLTVLKPVLKAPMVAELETII